MSALERCILNMLVSYPGSNVREIEADLVTQGVETHQLSVRRCLWRLRRSGQVIKIGARWLVVPSA